MKKIYFIVCLLSAGLIFSAHARADVLPIFVDESLPDGASLFTWSSEGPNVVLQRAAADAPEGAQYIRVNAVNNTTNFAGFGIFLSDAADRLDLRAYRTTGHMKFFVRSSTDLRVEIEWSPANKRQRMISAHGWVSGQPNIWQEVDIPLLAFGLSANQLSSVYGVFLITSERPAGVRVADFDVDFVRIEKPVVLAEDINTQTIQASIEDGQLILNNEPVILQGVSAEFIPVGEGSMYDYSADPLTYARDLDLMSAMGVNVIRLYSPPLSSVILDEFFRHGIRVIITYPVRTMGQNRNRNNQPIGDYHIDFGDETVGNNIRARFLEMVQHWGGHPAILMWCIGNEVNRNMDREAGSNPQAWYELINLMAFDVKTYEAGRPSRRVITAANAEGSSQAILDDIRNFDSLVPDLDIWSVQMYRGASFGSVFDDYRGNPNLNKPLFITEYGADAYDKRVEEEDEDLQAETLALQWEEIEAHLKRDDNEEPLIGSLNFAWRDGWWKLGNNSQHSTACLYQNPNYTDACINEEWWGLVGISADPQERHLRESYFTLQGAWRGEKRFLRGDSNCDASLDVSDAIYTLLYLFQTEDPLYPSCFDALDSNDDGTIDISDPVNLLNILFRPDQNPVIALPYPAMGLDPTPDNLKCAVLCSR